MRTIGLYARSSAGRQAARRGSRFKTALFLSVIPLACAPSSTDEADDAQDSASSTSCDTTQAASFVVSTVNGVAFYEGMFVSGTSASVSMQVCGTTVTKSTVVTVNAESTTIYPKLSGRKQPYTVAFSLSLTGSALPVVVKVTDSLANVYSRRFVLQTANTISADSPLEQAVGAQLLPSVIARIRSELSALSGTQVPEKFERRFVADSWTIEDEGDYMKLNVSDVEFEIGDVTLEISPDSPSYLSSIESTFDVEGQYRLRAEITDGKLQLLVDTYECTAPSHCIEWKDVTTTVCDGGQYGDPNTEPTNCHQTTQTQCVQTATCIMNDGYEGDATHFSKHTVDVDLPDLELFVDFSLGTPPAGTKIASASTLWAKVLADKTLQLLAADGSLGLVVSDVSLAIPKTSGMKHVDDDGFFDPNACDTSQYCGVQDPESEPTHTCTSQDCNPYYFEIPVTASSEQTTSYTGSVIFTSEWQVDAYIDDVLETVVPQLIQQLLFSLTKHTYGSGQELLQSLRGDAEEWTADFSHLITVYLVLYPIQVLIDGEVPFAQSMLNMLGELFNKVLPQPNSKYRDAPDFVELFDAVGIPNPLDSIPSTPDLVEYAFNGWVTTVVPGKPLSVPAIQPVALCGIPQAEMPTLAMQLGHVGNAATDIVMATLSSTLDHTDANSAIPQLLSGGRSASEPLGHVSTSSPDAVLSLGLNDSFMNQLLYWTASMRVLNFPCDPNDSSDEWPTFTIPGTTTECAYAITTPVVPTVALDGVTAVGGEIDVPVRVPDLRVDISCSAGAYRNTFYVDATALFSLREPSAADLDTAQHQCGGKTDAAALVVTPGLSSVSTTPAQYLQASKKTTDRIVKHMDDILEAFLFTEARVLMCSAPDYFAPIVSDTSFCENSEEPQIETTATSYMLYFAFEGLDGRQTYVATPTSVTDSRQINLEVTRFGTLMCIAPTVEPEVEDDTPIEDEEEEEPEEPMPSCNYCPQ